MKKDIINIIDKINYGYILEPERLISDYRREKENLDGYRGREILELLQNAVDELEETSDASIEISHDDNSLQVCNNGKAFSLDGFKSLIYSNLSPKYEKENFIGNKGTGFRSILNWADEVRIYSGDLAVEFSEAQAAARFAELMKNESVKNYCAGKKACMAILTAPTLIEKPANLSFDTVIELGLKDGIATSVDSQLNEISPETILFLPRLKELRIKNKGESIVFKKRLLESRAGNNMEIQDVQIESCHNNGDIVLEKWTIVIRKGKYKDKEYNVQIAFNDKGHGNYPLYSYFRTKIDLPLNALVHATLDLNADRNHLVQSEENVFILNIICDLLMDMTETFFINDVDEPSYRALEFLAPAKDFPSELGWGGFSFEQIYYSKIAARNIFPTVNGKYISFAEQPKFYRENFAKFLSGQRVHNLLKHSPKAEIGNFLSELAKSANSSLEYAYGDLVQAIDLTLPNLSLAGRASLWLSFIARYEKHILEHPEDPLPSFALDEHDNPVGADIRIFFPPEKTDIPSLPKFARLVFLSKQLFNALLSQPELESASRERLYDKLSPFKNIQRYALREVIRYVKNAVDGKDNKKRKKKISRERYNHRYRQLDFLNWLWQLHKAKLLQDDKSVLPNAVLFPDRTGKMREASTLYLGKDYDNPVAENLFPGQPEKFAGKPDFLTNKDPRMVREFLKLLGVKEFPIFKPKPKEIELDRDKNYKTYLISGMKVPMLATGGGSPEIYKSKKDVEEATFKSVGVRDIEGLDEILATAPTRAILDWLEKDHNLYEALINRYEDSESWGKIVQYPNINWRTIPGDKLPSYLYYVFSRSKWIEIGDGRFSPRQCLLTGKIGSDFAPLLLNPDLKRFIDPQKADAGFQISKIRNHLKNLGAAFNFASLDTETLYSLLLELPKKDRDGKISRSLYEALLSSEDIARKLDEESDAYKKFLQEGRAFCKSTQSFEPIGDMKYLSENISNALQNRYKLIDIHTRRNSEHVKKYFGVSKLSLEGELEGEPLLHPCNEEFKADFRNFLPYAFCKRINLVKAESASGEESYEHLAARLKNMNVYLCQMAKIKYGEETFELEENAFLRFKNKIYLRAPNNCWQLEELKRDFKFCSAIADIFRSHSGSVDDALFLFVRTAYAYSQRQRDAMIFEDFGSLEALERSRELLNIISDNKESFKAACLHFSGGTFDEQLQKLFNELDFQDLSSLENAPHLINILKYLEINVSDFNAKSALGLNLIPWYERKLATLRETNKHAYKNGLFASLKGGSLAEKKTFKEKYINYLNMNFQIRNDVNYDCEREFANSFGTMLKTGTALQADAQWQTNLSRFEQNRDKNIIEELINDLIFESLLYFGEEAEMEKLYQQKLKESEQDNSGENYKINVDLAKVEISTIKTMPFQRVYSAPIQRITPVVTSAFPKQGILEKRGALAEKIVYEKMKEDTEKYKNVQWLSENAKNDINNPDGAAGAGYDLKYQDKEGNEKFVEVKSSTDTKIIFYMSENELKVAEANPEKYEIWFVSSLGSDKQSIKIIPGLFLYADGEDRHHNNKFSCSADKWIISCVQDAAE